MIKPTAIAISILLLAGCAGAPKTPDWLDGSSAKYPSTRYLVGLGQADSAGMARDRARADLAKVFQVNIDEAMRDSTEFTSAHDVQGGRSTESRVERHLTVQTEQVLEGVKVPEVWLDKSGRYHALAVFDRLRAGQELRKEITSLDALTEHEIGRARSDHDLLKRIGAAARAAKAQHRREKLQRVLRIVDSAGVGMPPRYDSGRLDSDFRSLASRLKLSVSVEDDPTHRLGSLLGGNVVHAGFTSASEADADYRLVGALYLKDLQADDWYWTRGTLSLRLLDASGAVRGNWEWPVKTSGRQAALARQRSVKAVDKLLKAHLRDSILAP